VPSDLTKLFFTPRAAEWILPVRMEMMGKNEVTAKKKKSKERLIKGLVLPPSKFFNYFTWQTSIGY
jgi:hypothetical protein